MLTWPTSLVPSTEKWWIQNASRSGGVSITGSEQIVISGASRWSASLSVPVNNNDQVLAARALLAGLDGRGGSMLVGPFEVPRAPWNQTWLGYVLTYRRAATLAVLDPAGAGNPETSGALDFRVAVAAGLGATQITIQRTLGGVIQPGMYFSAGGRLHIVTALLSLDPGGPGTMVAQIRPKLRFACPVGTALEFGAPVGQMRLASDDTGALELELARRGTLSLDLVEAF